MGTRQSCFEGSHCNPRSKYTVPDFVDGLLFLSVEFAIGIQSIRLQEVPTVRTMEGHKSIIPAGRLESGGAPGTYILSPELKK
jgi:hypothetical protein